MTVPTLAFRPTSGGVVVDLDHLVRSRMLVQANSGGGKSRALRYLLEQTHGRVQHIVFDPEGEFASLRERYDYLLAGREGDVPADPRAAKLLARRLLELGTSAVLDLYDLSLPDRRRFVRLFLDELMHLPRALWRPVLVVIDEAHVFCPERGSGEAESTDAVITLCTQGRKRGYAAVLATQRLSKLHKDAAAELLNKLVGRTGLDVDVKRAGDDLGFDKDQRHTLKSLVPGTFYAYGPAIASSVTLVRTGDVHTSHPEAGTVSAPPPPAPAAIQRVLGELRDLPKQAEEEARSVADLARQLADARAKLARAERQGVERVVEKIVEKRVEVPVADAAVTTAAVRAACAQVDRAWRDALGSAMQGVDGARIVEAVVADAIAKAPARPAAAPVARPVVVRPASPRPVVRTAPAPRVASNGSAALPASEQRILDALALMEAIGAPGRKTNLGFFAGYADGGRFNNLLGGLRTRGLLEPASNDGMVALTDEGRAHANPDAHPVRSVSDLHALWLGKLPPSEGKVLGALLDVYPEPLTKPELGERTGYADGGRFNNLLGRLRSLGAIDYPRPGVVMATDVLFPAGLR